MTWSRTCITPLSEPMMAHWRIYASLGLNELRNIKTYLEFRWFLNTVKPVCNDLLNNKIYYLWFIQSCVYIKTEDNNCLLSLSGAHLGGPWPPRWAPEGREVSHWVVVIDRFHCIKMALVTKILCGLANPTQGTKDQQQWRGPSSPRLFRILLQKAYLINIIAAWRPLYASGKMDIVNSGGVFWYARHNTVK